MQKTTSTFRKLYRQLNPEQKKAVDTIEGPVMVIAGPGTGKTQILTLRIANILLKTNAEPENILALTFTEAAAYTMRRRLADLIGAAAYRVTIGTFHGFANDIIQSYPEEFPHIIGSLPIDEVDQIAILREIVEKENLSLLRPYGDTFYHVRALIQTINSLKREAVSVDELERAVLGEEKNFKKVKKVSREKEKSVAKNKELVRVYRVYESALRERRVYDYADMILEVVRAMSENENLRLGLQERYQYLLADEHQDANRAQNALLEHLAGYFDRPNLFIVGDEKQAIFRFQGASLENFNYFKSRFRDVALITLHLSYRSTQAILDSAGSLIEREHGALRAARKKKGRPVTVYECSRPEIEEYLVAELVKERMKNGVRPADIAVLYRDNRDAFPLFTALARAGIPAVIESDQNILEHPDVRKFIILIRALASFGEDERLVPLLHLDIFPLDPLDVHMLIARSRDTGLWNSLRAIGWGKELYQQLSGWYRYDRNHGLLETLELVLRESGLLASMLNRPDEIEAVDAMYAFFDEARTFVTKNASATFFDFDAHLALLSRHNVRVRRHLGRQRTDRVHLLTAHGAKGQEFSYVYITGAWDGHFGGRRSRSSFSLPVPALKESESDDERRLFYVALTRAKEEVVITHARTSAEGRERLPSRFTEEITSSLRVEGNAESYERSYERNKGTMLAAPPYAPAADRIAFVRQRFLEQGLSVTALNHYLVCPWEYYFVSLLRIPQAMSLPQMYGIAIHKGIADFFSARKEGKNPGEKDLVDFFLRALARWPIPTSDRVLLETKGTRALAGWHEARKQRFPSRYETPLSIRGVMLDEETMLVGELDRMDYLGPGREVLVTDYKTRAPESRNWIQGLTKNSAGDYYRQLVFYKVLLERYMDGRYRMVSGVIDFIEPNARGVWREETFEIPAGDVSELEKRIGEVSKEILSLAFWNVRCGKADCPYCSLREMMKNS